MITENEYPILEFDTERKAVISASQFLEKKLPEKCVITFFRKELEELAKEKKFEVLEYLHSEILDIPIYKLSKNVCITMPFATAPGAAGTIEELRAMGCEKFVICGGTGCLENIALGKVIIPTSAVRDEGTSYHYIPPAREIECDGAAEETAERVLGRLGIPYITGKTWTTDAFYRETAGMIELRKKEGCITVEMEVAAFFAVAKYYDLHLVQLLYAGDDISKDEWNSRNWNKQWNVRKNLIDTAIKIIEEI